MSTAQSILDTTPLMPPPAGVQSNFVNPVSNAYIVRIPTFVLLPLMLLFVGIRMIARFVLAHTSGADDCTFDAPYLPRYVISEEVLFHEHKRVLRLILLNSTRYVYRCNNSCDSLVWHVFIMCVPECPLLTSFAFQHSIVF